MVKIHEWALAESVVRAALDFKRDKGFSEVTRIEVRVGKLQYLDAAAFRLAVEEFAAQNGIGNAKLILTDENVVLRCRACGKKWVPGNPKGGPKERECIHFVPEVSHSYLRCPKCGSPDFEIRSGRGVYVKSIRGR